MGMFDWLRVDSDLFPQDPPPPVLREAHPFFQTKDIQALPTMGEFVITKDNRLMEVGYDYEDRSDPTAETALGRLIGMMTPVRNPEKDRYLDDFHGDIVFYEYASGEFWDYWARFTEGFCTSIKLLNHGKTNW